ncbi:MAG: hypothetical protein ISS82_06200 [Nanoarchaeota archaeon]|nr:hypothetical protein [Nanoarchaeota archaeon]
MKTFKQICREIKKLEIQGAEDVAIYGLKAYSLKPKKSSIRKLLRLRKTEPMLRNALKFAERNSVKEALERIRKDGELIANYGKKLIKNNYKIFTHCHSSTVIDILREAKKNKKKFIVYNTETRPLFQGRKTAKELSRLKIKVTTVVDSGARIALTKMGKVNLMLIGADAILRDKVINKIGSGMFAQIAYDNKIPVYVAAHSWKYTPEVEIEERSFHEIWKRAPKHVKIRNLAFESIPRKFIKGIICEKGVLSYAQFLKKK